MYAPVSATTNPLNTFPCKPGYLPLQSREMAHIPGVVQMCVAEEDIVCYFQYPGNGTRMSAVDGNPPFLYAIGIDQQAPASTPAMCSQI